MPLLIFFFENALPINTYLYIILKMKNTFKLIANYHLLFTLLLVQYQNI